MHSAWNGVSWRPTERSQNSRASVASVESNAVLNTSVLASVISVIGMEAREGSNPRTTVLQTAALPLRHRAIEADASERQSERQLPCSGLLKT